MRPNPPRTGDEPTSTEDFEYKRKFQNWKACKKQERQWMMSPGSTQTNTFPADSTDPAASTFASGVNRATGSTSPSNFSIQALDFRPGAGSHGIPSSDQPSLLDSENEEIRGAWLPQPLVPTPSITINEAADPTSSEQDDLSDLTHSVPDGPCSSGPHDRDDQWTGLSSGHSGGLYGGLEHPWGPGTGTSGYPGYAQLGYGAPSLPARPSSTTSNKSAGLGHTFGSIGDNRQSKTGRQSGW
ncbi:hypothetical protein I317_03899 [Kwoniella heveanensis CBS 569]|uniref:Uncharacterized protein n=1 Tax=Kwoniella heveanensis BCC8398 TaxID=1296120 RepID=A0A1B9GSM7_9TREE|nr:hypothetical protein I316_04387 [Kwoniella heveanensis BCC8398]OCF42280.1 hypothetical protein I317_03899 [Kwoniella heveanensis CBS 569]